MKIHFFVFTIVVVSNILTACSMIKSNQENSQKSFELREISILENKIDSLLDYVINYNIEYLGSDTTNTKYLIVNIVNGKEKSYQINIAIYELSKLFYKKDNFPILGYSSYQGYRILFFGNFNDKFMKYTNKKDNMSFKVYSTKIYPFPPPPPSFYNPPSYSFVYENDGNIFMLKE